MNEKAKKPDQQDVDLDALSREAERFLRKTEFVEDEASRLDHLRLEQDRRRAAISEAEEKVDLALAKLRLAALS